MRCFSENNAALCQGRRPIRRTTAGAFSLVEVVMALSILALISSSVLVVIDRCIVSAGDSALRMRAFEVARENMEKLLASSSVKETSEFGDSERHAGIKWQTVVEPFYEPITSRMWIRGVCSASYTDCEDQEQTVELTAWLTDLTKEQMLEIMKQQEQEKAGLGEELIDSVEEAAEYAEVDPETVEQWVGAGMPTEPDGSLHKKWIELYKKTDGKPSEEQRRKTEQQILYGSVPQKPGQTQADSRGQGDTKQGLDEIDPATGLTYEALEKMSFQEIYDLLTKKAGQK